MKPKLLPVLVAALFAPAYAAAQATPEWSGSATVGARNVNERANDPSKLNEYRDLESGAKLYGGFELRQRGTASYFNAYGENLGRDDQYLDLSGGRYGAYKYRLFSDELRHNFGAGPGALSPYSGIGTTTLSATLPNLSVATWNTFEHSYKRRSVGGAFELQASSPFYFRLDANEVKRDGINVFAGAKGTSPGNGFMDLPAPIDYTTRNLVGEVGYSTRTAHVAASLMRSNFDNANETLRWRNDFFAGNDTTTLTPSNDFTRFAINGNLRALPMDSTLAARYTRSETTTDLTLLQNMLSTSGANPATVPSEPTYRGNHEHTTLGLSLSSRISRALDTRLFWTYDKLDNKSTHITFNPAVGSGLRGGSTNPLSNCGNVAGTVCEPELFRYTKKHYGAEAGYRMSAANKLSGGLDYSDTDRERADFNNTEETRLFAELKNGSLDWAATRVKYQYLTRKSNFDPHIAVLAANPMDLYVRRFDLANSNQHLLKLGADLNPGGAVDLGFEVIYKQNRYQDTPLGRTEDQRQEFYGSIGFGDPKGLRLLAFGDIEYTWYESAHRVGLGNPDPATAPTTTTYNWTARNKDTAWQVGLGADWAIRTRFTVKASLVYAETEGRADFRVQPGGSTATFLPINNFDNTKRLSFNLRGNYEMTRNIELAAGYAYERYRFSDIAYDNTRYTSGTGTGASYATGEFSFQPYTMNIVYGTMKYKF